MKYTHKKLTNKIELEITLDSIEWEEELNNAYNKTKGKYSVTGFRKGKAPRKVIEKNYGDTVFFEDALTNGFYKAYEQIIEKEKDIEPIDAPNLSLKKFDGKEVVIFAEIPVMPEVKLGKYKDFNINIEPKKISEKDVTNEINKMQEQSARIIDVLDRPVKNGDIANIDFSGTIDGKLFDGGTAKAFDLNIGSKSFIDNFEEQLIGLKIDDVKDVKVKFPENYHAKEMAGKDAVFNVKINSIKEKQLPSLNDEFAANVSEFNTFDEYKKDVKAKLKQNAVEEAKIEKENKIIEKIVDELKVEVPQCLIEQELEHIIQDLEYKLMYQGIKLDDYAKYMNTTVEEIKKGKSDEAERNIKIRLALQNIIKLENISVTDKEIESKIEEIAKKVKKTMSEYKETLSEERLNYIKNDILINKLLNFLLENN